MQNKQSISSISLISGIDTVSNQPDRSPKTGDTVHVPAKKIPFFKPGKALKIEREGVGGTPSPSCDHGQSLYRW